MFETLLSIVSGAIKPLFGLIDELHTSDEERLKLKNQLQIIQNNMATEILKYQQEQIKAQKEIIVAEIKNGWLTRNWRPILMLTIVAIVANNYLIYPYLSMFTDKALVLELPDKLYNLMTVGVGGYVIGRSGEKIIDTFKK